METMSRPLRSRQRTRVRQDIQSAAWRLFGEAGYSSVTTKQIADAAGVSESTYFRHVASKDDLLLYPLEASSAAIVSTFAAQPTDVGVLRALADAIVERTEASSDAELELWRTALAGAPELRDRVTLIRDDDGRELVQLAAERMGVSGDSLEAGVRVHAVLAAAAYAYRRWFDGDSRELKTLIRDATDIVVSS
ncbi:putative TetR family transcriptional regulator [Gordonia malaquae NBRC 108250]|uniref:Putative TetR family transcriptional regulator n=2 Tax=Gordonia malaquae TaxID=410332 RepID=M3VBP3_GORML|nr:putative TetR family transcriptional regulator [Gordonia malaquae NBRC 108250]